MKTIFYLGSYRTDFIRNMNPKGSDAEDNKMKYVIDKLKQLGYKVVVISSLSFSTNGYHTKVKHSVDEQEDNIFVASLDTKIRIFRPFCTLFRMFSLLLELVKRLKKDDILLVYNSQFFSIPVRVAQRLKKNRVFLEIEELFFLDQRNPKDVRRKKIELALIDNAEGYVLANELLKEWISEDKKSVVLYGGYESHSPKLMRSSKNIIRVVYAGGIDDLRRPDIAVDAMLLLPDNYRLHILGNGNKQVLKVLEEKIQLVNQHSGFKKVEYLGCLYGKAFDEFLYQCDIGLNMQYIGSSIESAAFPSKISTYMSRGLSVVSGKLVSIENSPFSDYVTCFETMDSDSVAKAILNAPMHSKTKNIEFIKSLEQDFICKLSTLLEEKIQDEVWD